MATLILTTPAGASSQVPVSAPETTLGRAPRNDIMLNCPRVSRFHAVLNVDGPFVVIRDVGSRNGTYVNGKRVESQVLVNGDTIDLGDYWIRFIAADQEEVPADTVSRLTERGQLI